MAMSQIVISDWLSWGNLLKTWATKASYFGDGTVYPVPRNLDELKDQLHQTGAGSVPDWVTELELVEWHEEKLFIALPSRETIFNAEMYLRTGKPYPLPKFYRDAFGDLPPFGDVKTRAEFHTMRIGEHTINDFG
jgi:hypothetical protein